MNNNKKKKSKSDYLNLLSQLKRFGVKSKKSEQDSHLAQREVDCFGRETCCSQGCQMTTETLASNQAQKELGRVLFQPSQKP
jgi:coenzyme F420-reducing hydrogenase gamma subunit